MSKAIVLPIKLHPKQKEIDSSKARFKMAKWGRRGGKTRYHGKWTTEKALTLPGLHWHVNKTLDLVRDEFWPELLAMIPRDRVIRIDERLFKVTLRNLEGTRSVVACKSFEKDNNLRGRGLRSLGLDEAAFSRPSTFDVVLRPTLADHQAPALITSSARRSWFTEKWKRARDGKMNDWAAFHATIYDNPHIARTEIEEIKATTPEHIWLQEYMAEECDTAGTVYTEFSPADSVYDPSARFQEVKDFPCGVGIDYGWADPTAAVWLHVDSVGKVYVTQEHIRKGWDVARHAGVIQSKSQGLHVEAGYVLDKTAFRIEGTSRTSIAEQFRECGINCHRSEPNQPATVDLVRRYLRGDDSGPWMYISARCPAIINALQEWEFDDHEPDELAALRYGLAHLVRRGSTSLARIKAPAQEEKELDYVPDSGRRAKLPVGGAGSSKKSFSFHGAEWDSQAGGWR